MNNKFLIIILCFIILPHSLKASGPSCSVKVSQMFMVRVPPPPAKNVGGVIFFGNNFKNIKSPNEVIKKVTQIQKGRKPPLFIAIDQEGGLVQRLNQAIGFTDLPSHEAIGKADDETLAYDFGRLKANELAAVGVNWNFGTVVDVNSNKDNPVIGKYGRSLGSDPQFVAKVGASMVQGQIDSGIIPTIKHFPGHGDTVTDSHKGLAAVNKTRAEMESTELVPFQHILDESEVHPAVMVGHLSLPKILEDDKLPASLSKKIVTGWLRNKMNHKGLIVTDDLIMGAISKFYGPYEAVKKAILAGNDVLILGKLKKDQQKKLAKKLCKEAKNSSDLRSRIDDSYKRIMSHKRDFGILDSKSLEPIGDSISPVKHQQVVEEILKLANMGSDQKETVDPTEAVQ